MIESEDPRDLISHRLAPDLLALLEQVAALAAEDGMPLYLVGGVVRDLLLGHPALDLDLVVEGNAHELARRAAERLGGRAVTHERFGTATLYVNELSADLAMARTERYPEPGALPEVRPSSIADDLRRRDFTINAMAVSVEPSRFGETVDPLGGQADLDAGLVCVIHPASFVDDPTRMLRALRYRARFGFRLGDETAALLQRDAHRLAGISGDRIRHELARTLEETEPEKALEAAQAAGLLRAIDRALRWDTALSRRFARARKLGLASPAVYAALWGLRMPEADARRIAERLNLPNDLARPFLEGRRLSLRLGALARRGVRPSQIYEALKDFCDEAVAACRIATASPIIGGRLRRYTESLRGMKPELDGRDLMLLGVAEGPRVGAMLEALRRARLDGEARSRDEEVALVRRWMERGS